jgi:electron transport complex protein RnfB
MEHEDVIYRNLQKHMDISPSGFAATKSGAEIKLLQALYNKQEAEIATCLSTFSFESVETVFPRLKESGIELTVDELARILDEMMRKGLLNAKWGKNDDVRYKIAPMAAGGVADFQVNRLKQEVMDAFEQFHKDTFAQAKKNIGKADIPGLRVIPVSRSVTIDGKQKVASYDDIRLLIENAPGPLSVTNCICRQTKRLKGESCQYSDIEETCMQIGPDHARQYVEMGSGRYISKEEAFEILERAQDASFIFQPENSQNPENICCCCGDCCGFLRMAKNSPRPVDFFTTNYYARIDPELCVGCETCIKRCPLEAVKMADGVAVVDDNRCIGCGNCVVTCEANACILHEKEQKHIPPSDKETMYNMIWEKKQEKAKQQQPE